MTKRILSGLLVICMLLSLSACSKSEEAQAVDDIIANIGDVNLDSGDAKIIAAEEAVEALSNKDRRGLDYLEQLRGKRTKYNDLLVERVENAISAIGPVTVDSSNLLLEAKTLYESLPEELQKRILNITTLEDAEVQLATAIEERFNASVAEIEEAIIHIGTATLDKEKEVKDARYLYDKAESEVKEAVSNYNILVAAEEHISGLKVENTEKAIHAIGNVTLQSSSAIEAATRSYNSLSNAEKKLIKNENTLISAQASLKKLQDEEAKKAAVQTAKNTIQISRLWISSHDSVGGVELHINFTNKSPKTIKYLNFGVSFYNSVGDIVTSWRIDTIEYCQDVGPYSTGQGMRGSNYYWGKYYDWTIQSVKLVYLQIDYTDGTSWTASNDDLKSIQY